MLLTSVADRSTCSSRRRRASGQVRRTPGGGGGRVGAAGGSRQRRPTQTAPPRRSSRPVARGLGGKYAAGSGRAQTRGRPRRFTRPGRSPRRHRPGSALSPHSSSEIATLACWWPRLLLIQSAPSRLKTPVRWCPLGRRSDQPLHQRTGWGGRRLHMTGDQRQGPFPRRFDRRRLDSRSREIRMGPESSCSAQLGRILRWSRTTTQR